MKTMKLLGVFVCMLALGACQTVGDTIGNISDVELPALHPAKKESRADEFVEGSCPQVEIVEELGALSEFSDTERSSRDTLISGVLVSLAGSSCAYTPRSVTVDLRLAFEGHLGPQGRLGGQEAFFSYPFFVAVVSPQDEILAKEVFSAAMSYEAGQETRSYFENLRQIIPITSRSNGARHKVLVGFQLTEEQLAHNRSVIKRARAAQAAVGAPPPVLRAASPMQSAPVGSVASENLIAPGPAPQTP